MKSHLYIRNALYGECDLPEFGTKLFPSGVTYCCPKCGDVWARFIPLEGNPTYTFHAIPCPSCGTGSLRLWDNFPLDTLPLRILIQNRN